MTSHTQSDTHTKTAHVITYTLLQCTETAHNITYTLLPHTRKLLMTSHTQNTTYSETAHDSNTQNATHKLATPTALFSHFQMSIVNKLACKVTEKMLFKNLFLFPSH